jgi:hypothetical protein
VSRSFFGVAAEWAAAGGEVDDPFVEKVGATLYATAHHEPGEEKDTRGGPVTPDESMVLVLDAAHGAQFVHARGADAAVFFPTEREGAPIGSRVEAHTTKEVKERAPLLGRRGGQATDQQAVEAGTDHPLHRGWKVFNEAACFMISKKKAEL